MTVQILTENDLNRLINAVENPSSNAKFFYGDIRDAVLNCLKELQELREEMNNVLLEDPTDKEIIDLLLKGKRLLESPKRRSYCIPHVEVILSLDNDNIALLTMPKDCLTLLNLPEVIDPDLIE